MCCLGSRSKALFVGLSGDEEDMSELFRAEEPSGLNKRELYKQNKEAQMMERLERRMEGKPQLPPDEVLSGIQRLDVTGSITSVNEGLGHCRFLAPMHFLVEGNHLFLLTMQGTSGPWLQCLK